MKNEVWLLFSAAALHIWYGVVPPSYKKHIFWRSISCPKCVGLYFKNLFPNTVGVVDPGHGQKGANAPLRLASGADSPRNVQAKKKSAVEVWLRKEKSDPFYKFQSPDCSFVCCVLGTELSCGVRSQSQLRRAGGDINRVLINPFSITLPCFNTITILTEPWP